MWKWNVEVLPGKSSPPTYLMKFYILRVFVTDYRKPALETDDRINSHSKESFFYIILSKRLRGPFLRWHVPRRGQSITDCHPCDKQPPPDQPHDPKGFANTKPHSLFFITQFAVSFIIPRKWSLADTSGPLWYENTNISTLTMMPSKRRFA